MAGNAEKQASDAARDDSSDAMESAGADRLSGEWFEQAKALMAKELSGSAMEFKIGTGAEERRVKFSPDGEKTIEHVANGSVLMVQDSRNRNSN